MITITIEEKLNNLILSRYKSIREFTQVADIPYTTMKSILNRGIGNSSVTNIIKVCKALHISVDALAEGRIETRYESIEPNNVEMEVAIQEVKSMLTATGQLTINGNPIDIEEIDPIVEGIDIGYEMVKRKQNR